MCVIPKNRQFFYNKQIFLETKSGKKLRTKNEGKVKTANAKTFK